MDFELSEEQRAFQDIARSFADRELAPHAAAWDEQCVFPVETLRAAAALGFGGIYVREAAGGAGLSRLDAALIFEELATGCTSTAAYLSIHNMVAWMIDAFGVGRAARALAARPDDHGAPRELLPDRARRGLGRGEPRHARRRARATTTSSTAARPSSRAPARATSTPAWCAPAGPAPAGISCLVVERGTPGLSFGKPEKKLGWHSQPTAMVIFEACRVPRDQRIGAEGEGFRIAMAGLDGGRINIAACALGAARACFERARAHLLERRQFGRRLAEFQALQFRLADMATELEAARLMVWRAAHQLDRAAPDATMACAMAKRFATDVAFEVCNNALQLHGGYGYIKDYRNRALPSRRPRPPDPRRHQRDHAPDHRPPSARRLTA